jgi:hypothetical protein
VAKKADAMPRTADIPTAARDEHVAAMEQRDFDELVEGCGPLRYQVGHAYDPVAAVEQHRVWTRVIVASA